MKALAGDNKRSGSERGVVLMLAIVMSLIVFLIVTAALNVTFGRFNLSFMRTDHSTAFYAAEAGVRYAFARLELDTTYEDNLFKTEPLATRPQPGFANAVRHAAIHAGSYGRRAYVISSLPAGTTRYDDRYPVGAPPADQPPVDRQDPALLVGARNVTVWIRAGINGAGNPEFRVRVFTYGTSS